MKQSLFYLTAIVITTAVILSCKKGNDSKFNMVSADATVIYKGDPAADGCGWQITTAVSDSTYFPINLTTPYQINNLKVHIVYHKLTQRYHCANIAGLSTDIGVGEIQLDTIRVR